MTKLQYFKVILGITISFNSICVKFQRKALNIPGIQQLVAYSKSEYDLQGEARNRQTVTTANEQANKTMLARLKQK